MGFFLVFLSLPLLPKCLEFFLNTLPPERWGCPWAVWGGGLSRQHAPKFSPGCLAQELKGGRKWSLAHFLASPWGKHCSL